MFFPEGRDRSMAGKIVSLLLILSLVISAIALFQAHKVSAILSEVWVAKTGSDGNLGTEASPYLTIQKGIDTLEACAGGIGTVHVAAGTYPEHLLINDAVDLAGAGAQHTIIDGSGTGRVLDISSIAVQNVISGFTIQNGNFSGNGGGIYIGNSHNVTLNDCLINDNEAQQGGGIYSEGQLHMYRCTVSNNSALSGGGGIYGAGPIVIPGSATTYLTNCTISGNTITGERATGGGIYNSTNAETRLLNVTIADNHATHAISFGGGYADGSPSSMYFKNCIVANNTAGNSDYNNGYQALATGIYSEGYNIDSENVEVSRYFKEGTDQTGIDPLLGPLQDNGGPTFTHAISQASPAFNGAIEGPETDQRVLTRPMLGGYDIGAYELQQLVPPTVTSCSPAQGTQGQSFIVTITGTYLTGATSVSFSGTGITAGIPTVISNTQVTVSINIEAGAAPGARNISVTTPGGTGTKNNVFTVIALPAPPAEQPFTGMGTGNPGGSSGSMSSTISTAQSVVNPTFIIQAASISRAQTSGDPVIINANVANTSTVNGITKVRLYVNGQLDAEQVVTVASGQQKRVSFTVSRNEPGSYRVYINGTPAGSFTVSDNSTILYISIACLFLALVLGVILIYRRFTV